MGNSEVQWTVLYSIRSTFNFHTGQAVQPLQGCGEVVSIPWTLSVVMKFNPSGIGGRGHTKGLYFEWRIRKCGGPTSIPSTFYFHTGQAVQPLQGCCEVVSIPLTQSVVMKFNPSGIVRHDQTEGLFEWRIPKCGVPDLHTFHLLLPYFHARPEVYFVLRTLP